MLFYYATVLHKRRDFFNLSFRAKSSIFAEEEDLDEEDEEEKDDSCGVNKVQRKEGAF